MSVGGRCSSAGARRIVDHTKIEHTAGRRVMRSSTRWRDVVTKGIIDGIIGFTAVAVVFIVADTARGRPPLYTAALLGAAVFYGATDPARIVVSAAPVLSYTLLHLAVFLAFGILASALAALADRGWQLWFVSLFLFIFISYHLTAAVQLFAAPMQAMVSPVEIWSAGLVASAAMAAYLVRVHPRMRAAQAW
jgi:hypothetical protein